MAKPRLDDPLTADQLLAALDYEPATGDFIWRPKAVRSQHATRRGTRGMPARSPAPPRFNAVTSKSCSSVACISLTDWHSCG